MTTGQNKIYYDVNIPYKAEEANPKYHYYSKAETEIRLNGPLIPDPTEYDLAISKFKVDTECLPVFIPEMKHPDGPKRSVFTKTGEGISNYVITAYYPRKLKDNIYYSYKRREPIEWTEVPLLHEKDENFYEYYGEGDNELYRGKIVHPFDWTPVDDCQLPYDKDLYEYGFKEKFNKIRTKIQEPRDWTEIPKNHFRNELLYYYWDYDGHNEYIRISYDFHDGFKKIFKENETNEEDPWEDIPENHQIDFEIYQYKVEDLDDDREHMILRGLLPKDFEDVSVQHIQDDKHYEYQDFDRLCYAQSKTFFPIDYEEIPKNHVRDERKFEYTEAETHEEYKARLPVDEPKEWTEVPEDHERDEERYEYRTVIDEPAYYKGKTGAYQYWTPIRDIPDYEENKDLFKERYMSYGKYKGKIKVDEELKEFKPVPDDHVRDEKMYDYRALSYDDEPTNNGFIFGSVSENVTFFMNEGGPTTQVEFFTNRNKFPATIYSGWEHPENTDPAYFQYDYQSVLDRINVAIERLLGKLMQDSSEAAPLTPLIVDETIMQVYFDLNGDKIRMNINEDFLEKNILLKFSANLYKYIGNGFKCRFYNNPGSTLNESKHDGSFFIDYNPFLWRHKRKFNGEGHEEVADINCFNVITPYDKWHGLNNSFLKNHTDLILFQTNSTQEITNSEQIKRTYYQFEQQYSTLANWNICKCILICSSSFPIKPEYYPTLNKNMTLTHYKEDWYVNLINKVYNESAYAEDNQIFDKASTKILDVYYPLSSTGGDIRSCIIYSNENIEGGNKIDMVGGMDLENFDIKVKWVDLYGNVYDLYLAPGCSVNIRLCLTRKKILKDEILRGFKRVHESLDIIAQSKIPPEDASESFKMKLAPPRQMNKLTIDGYLDNGLILKP